MTPQIADDWIPTRQSLLSRLRDWDDRVSWEDFFNTYWRLIYNVARKSGLTDVEAQEVVQETVITVAKQIPAFRYDPNRGAFKGWLLNTTQWRIGDQFRKRKGPVHIPPDEGMSAASSEWERLWDENLLAAAVARVKRRANLREFQIFDLAVNHQWEAGKIAQKFRVTRAHVYYARQKIARLIRKEMKRLEDET